MLECFTTQGQSQDPDLSHIPLQEPRAKTSFCIFVFFIKIAFFMLLYLLEYFKCHCAVVVLQGGDVIVAECEFSPSIYLQRVGHPYIL